MERVRIFDTTLRDGEQSPGCSMNVAEKVRMAHQLDGLGVDVMEAGFPIASEGDFAAVQAIAAAVRRPMIAGLARACGKDIERAWQALQGAARPRIHVFLATSDIHLKYKLRISREQCLEQAREAVRLAKSFCADVEFSPEDATRTEPEFLCQVVEAVVAEGATTVNIPDTVGFSTPAEFGELIRHVREKVRESGALLSPRTAIMILDWRWPIHWRLWLRGRARWSARLTGSENVRAMRRWKRSLWRCGCGRIG